MVDCNKTKCPDCGGILKKYDVVKRIVRRKGRCSDYVDIRRLRCLRCHCTHRELPDSIFPFKQYEAEIIQGVLDGYITPDTYGYEDYPCELTMKNWIAQNSQGVL